MSQFNGGGKAATVSLDLEGELSEDALDGIAGGAVTLMNKKDKNDELDAELATSYAPEFKNSGNAGANASAGTNNGTASASASAMAGHTDVADLGNGVTLTNRYSVGVSARAEAGPLGVGAGVTAGAGASSTYNLGRGVEIETALQATAKAGVSIGIKNNSLAGTGGASADINAKVGQSYESGEFGDGAKVKQSASVTAGVKAEAAAEALLGAGGVKTKYGASAGAYAKASVDCEVGNETAAGKVECGIISPGSVSVGMTGGATVSGGKLTLSFGQELAVGIAGFSVNVSLDVQLFDNTHTVGTPEEIKEIEDTIAEWSGGQDDRLTEEWRRGLESDARDADTQVRRADADRTAAQSQVNRYNQDIAKEVAGFTSTRDEIERNRTFAKTLTDEATRSRRMEECGKAESDLNARISDFEKRMSDPKEIQHRDELMGKLNAAQSKYNVMKEIADGVHERLEVANSTTFMSAVAISETTMHAADARLNEFQRNLEFAQNDYNRGLSRIQKQEQGLGQDESRVATLNKQIAEQTAFGKDAGGLVKELKEAETVLARHRADIAAKREDLEKHEGAKLKVEQQRYESIKAQHDQVKEQMIRLNPIKAAEADAKFARDLLNDLKASQDSVWKTATKAERQVMEANAEAAQFLDRLYTDNAHEFDRLQAMYTACLEGMEAEHARLTEVVTDKGVLTSIGSALGIC